MQQTETTNQIHELEDFHVFKTLILTASAICGEGGE
jgi:hypothetical protein